MIAALTLHPEMPSLAECLDRKFHYDAANDRCTNDERNENESYSKIFRFNRGDSVNSGRRRQHLLTHIIHFEQISLNAVTNSSDP